MASLGDVFVSVLADTSGFEDSLQDGLRSAVGRTVLGGVLGGVISAGVAKAVKEFLPLEKAILQIFQVQGINASDAMFAALQQQILDVSNQVARPAEEVGAAIALGVGRGFDQTASVELTKISGQLANAIGDGSSLADNMKLVTAALNGFNVPAEKATEVAGTLFQAISKSGAPVGQFAQQLGSIGPLATSANLGLGEVTAAIATLVQNGNSPAEAVTNIRTAITELSDSQTTGGKVFKEISGKTFPEFVKAGGNLQQALLMMKAASDKSKYSVSDLTSNYNTQNAIVGLTGGATEQFTKNLADNKVGVDAMGKALESAQQGGLFRFNEAMNKVKNGVIQVGSAFRPVLDILAARLTPAVDWVAAAFTKLAQIISQIDFNRLNGVFDRLVMGLQPIGQLIVAIYNVLSALNWNQIFDAIQAASIPALAAFAAIALAAKVLAEVIEFLTPLLRPLVDVFSYLAVGAAVAIGVIKIFSAFKIILIGVKVAMFLLGPVIRTVTTAITVLRTAMLALSAATGIAILPLTLIVGAIAAVVIAFGYAWKESQKFREVVVSVVNNVKNAVVTYFEFMATAVLTFVRAWLTMAKTIVDVVAKVPVLGGAAKGVSQWLQSRINELNAVEAKVHEVAGAARAMNWELEQAATGWGLGYNGPSAEDIARENGVNLGGAPKMPTFTPPKISGLGELLDPAKKGPKDNSKEEAARIAKQIRDLLQGLYDDVRDLAKGIGSKTLDSIQSGFDSLLDKYRDAITTAADLGQKTVVARLKKSLAAIKVYQKKIEAFAKKRDALTDQIDAANDALKAVTDFRNAAKAAFADLGKVTEGSAGIGVTFLGIRNNLRDAIRTTTAFSVAFKKLQQLNLNDTALRQIADAGPAALDQAQALARSGAKGVAEINNLQKELDKVTGANADNMTKEFFNLGVAQAEGIVKGLQSQQAKLVKEMEKLGAAMVAGMKKTLQIKSPSRVFDELGRQVPAGMAQGVRRGTPDVISAINAMAKGQGGGGIDVGGVTVNGVSDPAAARRAGLLAGDAIASTLSRRSTAQVLSGVK